MWWSQAAHVAAPHRYLALSLEPPWRDAGVVAEATQGVPALGRVDSPRALR
jgi:hypothetical protein